MILLDTCGLLWLAHEQEKISEETLQMIEASPIVYASAITSFEVGLKYKSGKLQLPLPPQDWFEQVLAHHDITVLDLTSEI